MILFNEDNISTAPEENGLKRILEVIGRFRSGAKDLTLRDVAVAVVANEYLADDLIVCSEKPTD